MIHGPCLQQYLARGKHSVRTAMVWFLVVALGSFQQVGNDTSTDDARTTG